MRSRADGRRALERALRGVAWVGLAAMLVGALLPAAAGTIVVGSTALERAPRDWFRDGLPSSVRVHLTNWPTSAQRDGLAAVRSVGTDLMWSHELPALAVEVEPSLAPLRDVTVRATGMPADGEGLVLRDAIGRLDPLAAGPETSAARAAPFGTRVTGMVHGRDVLQAVLPDIGSATAVVLGRVGWETRFLVDALEARGWSVAARLEVAPGRFVTQGRPTPLDPARVAVVFVVDESASPLAPGIGAFLSGGGGVVLYAAAAVDAGLGRLAPATVEQVRATGGALFASTGRAGLPARGIGGIAPDAIVLEERDGLPVLVGRRVGAGRVVLVAYADLWRWQMSGDTTAGYQRFVSDLASSAGRRVVRGDAFPGGPGAAPLAALAAAWGPPTSAGPMPVPAGTSDRWLAVLAALVFGALGAEWASRRLRSVP